MWNVEILGVDLYHIFAWLFLYSIMGWIWESSYVSIKEKKLVNRGFVTGPVCTIYGVGAVSVYLILRPLDGNVAALYFGGVFVATLLEYMTAVIMETLFHTNWWDYSNKKFNLHGRICLGSSVAWGFFTLVMFEILQPFVEMIVGLVSEENGKDILTAVMLIYAMDFGFAMATAMQLAEKLRQMEQAMAEFTEKLQESRIFTSASEVLESLEPYRKSLGQLNIRERMEKYQELMAEQIEKTGLTEQKEAIAAKLKVVNEKMSNVVLKGGWNSRRLIKAYPNMGKASMLRRRLARLRRLEKNNHKKDTE